MADVNLSLKVPAELKLRVQTEAETLGKSLSAHGRSILEQHFEVQSVEQVREHLADLTATVQSLADRPGGGGADRAETNQLSLEVARLKEQVGVLTATVHHALRIIVFHDLRPTESQFEELEGQFEQLRKHYQAGV